MIKSMRELIEEKRKTLEQIAKETCAWEVTASGEETIDNNTGL